MKKRYTKQFWKRSGKKGKNPFGGTILSHDKIQALNETIITYEAKELEAYEVEMDEALKGL